MSNLTFLIPIVSWLCLNLATGVLLTTPSCYRPYFLPAILIPTVVSFKTIQYLTYPPGLREIWGLFTLIGYIHFSSLIYLKKWTFRPNPRTNLSSKTVVWLSCVQIYKIVSSPRYVNIPYDNVPLFRKRSRAQVKSTATRTHFMPTKLLWLTIQCALLVILNALVLVRILGVIHLTDFTPDKTILIRRLLPFYHSKPPLSTREVVVRVWFTVNLLWAPVLLTEGVYTFLAVLFIYVVRCDGPEDWPDLFGNPFEAYNLGRFWTRFWHRVHLHGYNEYVNLVLKVLPNPIGCKTTIRKFIKIFMLFVISGFVHQLVSVQLDRTCGRDGADVRYYCLHAFAVCLEDMILEILSGWVPMASMENSGSRKGRMYKYIQIMLLRLSGYAWVIGFLLWATPKVYYSRVLCTVQQEMLKTKVVT